ncbi:hypothetical protein SKAU_G00143830 [Synaphobranchus kaupii]|uniref:Uncharacterized protein n=1 Tax=Synaphobranchus kaupii TaxID=118154 RepID=A0A9Q1J2E7_SYNKA|nr:hypothetical protein SKAU_G00143830 [Synaphobranchus kaupii]
MLVLSLRGTDPRRGLAGADRGGRDGISDSFVREPFLSLSPRENKRRHYETKPCKASPLCPTAFLPAHAHVPTEDSSRRRLACGDRGMVPTAVGTHRVIKPPTYSAFLSQMLEAFVHVPLNVMAC